MKTIACLLTVFSLIACGGGSRQKDDSDMSGASANNGDMEAIRTVIEIRDDETRAQVGTIFQRDHGNGRLVYWVHDMSGTRQGYITDSNDAFKYHYVMGKRDGPATALGADTMAANARRIIGYGRPVKLEEIGFEAWVEKTRKK